jgi:hypothetical protein
MTRRYVEVDLSINDPDQLAEGSLARQSRLSNKIMDKGSGFGWEYGETRGDSVVYYKDFESDDDFDAALGELRELVGGEEHVTEIDVP